MDLFPPPSPPEPASEAPRDPAADDAALRERFLVGVATGLTLFAVAALLALAAFVAPALRAAVAAGADLPAATRLATHPLWAWTAPFVAGLGLLRVLALRARARRARLALLVAGAVAVFAVGTLVAVGLAVSR